ncbi:uncharacterized protein LOC144549544 [Carex rostrata]
MEGDRSWMYGPRYVEKKVNPVFVNGVEEFFNYAFSIPNNVDKKNRIKCHCANCGCTRWWDRYTIGKHLLKSGFRLYYETWTMHGECVNVGLGEHSQTVVEETVIEESVEVECQNDMIEIVVDAAGPSFDWEQPNSKAQEFYNMMNAAEEPLWDGCDKEHTVLACVTELLSIKSDCGITKEGFNRILSAVKKWLLKENRLPPNQYQCKKLVKGLGLSHVKIHACPNDCMLYYGDNNISKEKCDVCGHDRFKPDNHLKPTKRIPYKILRYLPITPRLLRLFLSSTTAEQMRWHKEGKREKEGVMVHPADGEA